MIPLRLRLGVLAVLTVLATGACARGSVAEVSRETIEVADGAFLPIYVSRDWTKPLPDIERAVILQHGVLRDADVYFRTALDAQAAAGAARDKTLMIAPQFIDPLDGDAHHVAANVLRYTHDGWIGGDDAVGPTPVSAFAAMDAILNRLADRRLFPNLKIVVVAGHSAGGQFVQRYAIVGKGDAALTSAGISARYVVANPSSYAYFSPDRPAPEIANECPGYDDWKYGMVKLPAYAASETPAAFEKAYVSRRVIYMLGALDVDPNQPALNKSCMAEAQGPSRFARGQAYVASMQAREGGTPNHTLFVVPNVGHNGDKIFTSACGLTALFDVAGCR